MHKCQNFCIHELNYYVLLALGGSYARRWSSRSLFGDGLRAAPLWGLCLARVFDPAEPLTEGLEYEKEADAFELRLLDSCSFAMLSVCSPWLFLL